MLGALNISSGIAISIQGDGATFNLDKADPVGYGVFIPAPNMYTTMSISGSNQGEFVAMSWLGTPSQTETVAYPGNDISYAYPWYFENYIIDSTTNNDYIDPWSVEWLNVSAYNAENDTLSPYTLNTVFNYYVMAEGSELTVPINNSMPMQIDILIDNTGPKMLKMDFIIDDPNQFPLDNINLVSPSGKLVNFDLSSAIAGAMMGSINVFNYMLFVPHEQGTYRLLIDASYATNPAYINLEFLDFKTTNLAVNKVVYGSAGDDFPSIQDMWEDEWDAEWFKLSGKKGDKFTLDYGFDYAQIDPTTDILVDIWYPCENGYILDSTIFPGSYDIYFPKTGDVYISISDILTGGVYKASLYVKEIPVVEYNIGDNVTSIRVSRDERKAIDFTVEQDSFVRFNYTEWGEGDAEINTMGITNGINFKDTKKLRCYEVLSPIETKTVDSMAFYYYYFPAGEYEAIILNDDSLFDGVLQISSNFVEWANDTIPINSLTYPEVDGSQYITLEFGPDEYYSSLKEAQWIGINVTEPGQYRLNTTIWTTDNSGASATGGVSHLYTYNDTDGEYYSFGYPQPAFSTDGDTTVNDYLYIGAPTRWTGMLINFTIPGVGGFMSPRVHVGSDNWNFMGHSDDTIELTQDGVIEFTLTDTDFRDWTYGTGTLDIDPSIDENDYYWLRLDCTSNYGTVPIIELITLLNQTIKGDVNFALLRESGYQYDDTWGPTGINQPSEPDGLRVSQDEDNDLFGTLEYDSSESFIIKSSDPNIIGFEEGLYKLLIVPENWDYSGSIKIRFTIEDYWGYHVEQSYTIDQNPVAHSWQIGDMVNVGDSILYNYSTYPYDFSITYNDTEVTCPTGSEAYIAIKCYGKPYSWTQLVVGSVNISDYELYILQDLPWINNGPNGEQMRIAQSIGDNHTFEFGVIRDNFTLLFEILGDHSPDEMVTLNIGLRQYNTTALYGSEITAIYTTPVPGLDPLLLTLLIAIPAAIGVVVVIVYVVKKRGK